MESIQPGGLATKTRLGLSVDSIGEYKVNAKDPQGGTPMLPGRPIKDPVGCLRFADSMKVRRKGR